MSKLLTLLRLLAPNDRPLWGVAGLRISYAHFAVYAALAWSAATSRPIVGGIAMATAAVVEASDALAGPRFGLTTQEMRRGFDIRTQWRTPLFVLVLAAAPAPTGSIGTFAGLVLVAAVLGRIMRSDRLMLLSDRRLRPLGAMTEGVHRLARARRVERLRDLSELWLQVTVTLSALMLTLPTEFDITTDSVIVGSLGLGAVAVGYAAVMAVVARRLRPEMLLQHDRQVLEAFLAYEPEVLCYFNGHPGSGYGVDVWLRTFENCGKRVALIYRHQSVESVDTTRLPGLVVREDPMVEKVVGPSTRVALYPANGTLNVHLQRDKRLAHVFIGHGDSDKAGSANPYTQSYDQVWVSGQAGIDRYHSMGVDIPMERFVVVGRPPLSPRVRTAAAAHFVARHAAAGHTPPLERLHAELERHDSGEPPHTILYAPTWEGYFEDSDYSSIESMGLDLVDAVVEHLPGVRIIFKPHPLTGHRRPELLDIVEAIRRRLAAAPDHHPSTAEHPDVDLYDWFDLADLLIADVSSVITDFMMWNRPFVATNPLGLTIEEFHRRFPSTTAAYVVDRGTRSTPTVFRSALDHDPLRSRRIELQRHFVGPPEQDSLDLFSDALETLARSARRGRA